MKRKQKIKMAGKMLTRTEREKHCPVFQSKAWLERKESRQSPPLNEGQKTNNKTL